MEKDSVFCECGRFSMKGDTLCSACLIEMRCIDLDDYDDDYGYDDEEYDDE